MQSVVRHTKLQRLLITAVASLTLLLSACDNVVIIDPNASDSIATVISTDPQFSKLNDALQAANLTNTLAADGAFTVFAPNNAAFDALDVDVLNELLADPNALRDVLLYHVVQGQSIDALLAISVTGTQLTSAAGEPLNISMSRDTLMINTASVIRADITATNGIIHEIDTVLMP